MFKNIRVLRHLFLCLSIFVCHGAEAIEETKASDPITPKLLKILSPKKRKYHPRQQLHHSFKRGRKTRVYRLKNTQQLRPRKVNKDKVYQENHPKVSISSLFNDLKTYSNLDKAKNLIMFRGALAQLEKVKSQLSLNAQVKLSWYQGYYLLHLQNDLSIFEGLKLLTQIPKTPEFHHNNHDSVVTWGYERLCGCLASEQTSLNKHQYSYLIDYMALMSEKYPDFLIADYDFRGLEQTFTHLRQTYHYSSAKIIKDLRTFSNLVDTDKLTRIIGNLPGSKRDEDGVDSSNDYYITLFRLLLEPVHKVVRERNTPMINCDQPYLISNAIPVPQQAAVVCKNTIPLATGNVCDCVAVYAYTEIIHGLAHYDRYCRPSDLQKFFQDIQEGSKDNSPLFCHLFTTRFTTQLQNIYGFLKTRNIKNIQITISYPNHFFSQQSYRTHRDGRDYYTNLFDGVFPRNYQPVNITCLQGVVSHGKTKNTIASKEMVNLRIKTLNAIVRSDMNKSNIYLTSFFKVFKSKYRGLGHHLKYLYGK